MKIRIGENSMQINEEEVRINKFEPEFVLFVLRQAKGMLSVVRESRLE